MNEYIIVDSPDKKLAVEYLYCVEKYHTMIFKVKSKGFYGESSFCMSNDTLICILEVLESISKDLNGGIQFKDIESDATINIEMKRFGKAEVFGQVGSSHQDHFMRFKFESDQTLLMGLIKFIKEYLV